MKINFQNVKSTKNDVMLMCMRTDTHALQTTANNRVIPEKSFNFVNKNDD